MACWENAGFYFYYYYFFYLFPFAATVTFSVHWNINIRHQDEKLVGEIGERGTSYVFYSMTFWKISEIVEELVLLLNIKTISHKFWNAQGIYLPQLNRKLLLYLDALVYNVPFFCCVHFFLEAPLFPVVYSPFCFGCFCYCEPVNTFCTEYKKPFSS